MPAPVSAIFPRPERGILPALALILAADTLLYNFDLPRLIEAALDEPAHLATAFLLLATLPAPPTVPFLTGVALGAVGIDADHVPGELGWAILTRGTGRPITHSLVPVAALLLLSRALSGEVRTLTMGATCGVLMHLVRDIGMDGVPLFWPLSKRRIAVPHGVYLATLAVAAAAGWCGGSSRR